MSSKLPPPLPERRRNKPRVLLDSNVWRYVHDAQAEGRLIQLARDGTYDVLISPAVVYEALRLKNVPMRNALVRLMAHKAFKRLMPEAYSESMEFLVEVERVRPNWFRPAPELTAFKRQRNDWWKTTGGFWVRLVREPGREAGYLAPTEVTMIEGAKEQAVNARREFMVAGWKINRGMDKTMVSFMEPTPGWRGDEFQMWRADALTAMTYALAIHGNAYRDWIGPFIDVDDGLLHSPDWVDFWVYGAKEKHLPRQWLRWAHAYAQRFRKVTDGTPADSQLSTYFLETDVVISADKILLTILDEIRPFAPCRLPIGHLVPGGQPGVEALLDYLAYP